MHARHLPAPIRPTQRRRSRERPMPGARSTNPPPSLARGPAMPPDAMSAVDIAQALGGARQSGAGYKVRCPAHDDHNPSLQLDDKAGKVVVHCHAGCEQSAVIDELKARGLWMNGHDEPDRKPQIVATYDYTDEGGNLLYQVVRYDPKGFKQRRPDGDGWAWNLKGVRAVPFRLPALIEGIQAGKPIFIVEGEKDVLALGKLCLVATCNAGGAGKWRPEWAPIFAGARVYIFPDNDDSGRKHGQQITQSLQGTAASVSIINLPGLLGKGDVSDWLAAGGDAVQLLALIEGTPPKQDDTVIADHGDADESDDGLAIGFARTRPHFRRVAAWGRWLRWTGTHWTDDLTLAIYSEVREYLRWKARQTDDRTGERLRSAGTVAAVERLAQSDRGLAATTDQWDVDPWLLNTPDGVVDLRTGTLKPHSPALYLTKLTACGPAGECPLWLQFLDEVTEGNEDLSAFLQRVAGYSLTGITREHALFFGYGGGGNGKGTFINTLAGVLKDYARSAAMETFTESQGERHPTDLAMLQGARLVVSQETEEGRRWAESRIKALTGGDPITARYMRQDFFTFQPQFKLLIAGNHKPRLSAVDEAMRRRLHLIPFNASFPQGKRDPDLPEKLRAEWPGILQWAIEGCLDYQAAGLNPPEIVVAATSKYFEGQDVFADWRGAHCDIGPTFWDPPTRLYKSWCTYAEAIGERPGRQREFTDRLESAGFRQGRDSTRGRFWSGIAVKHDTHVEGWS